MFGIRGKQEEPLESSADRLDSWKEIAAYLKRDVSTLHRWEKSEGLPVHRHQHSRAASVYAYRSELDAWWNNRRENLESKEAVRSTRQKHLLALLGIPAGFLAFLGLAWWLPDIAFGPDTAGLDFQERDWVLISDFENRTGENLFDGTLEYALERELANSRYVNVVPHPRIHDALRLMQKPADAALDAVLAREVCLRDGDVSALFTGRIDKVDGAYVLGLQLVNPRDGVILAASSETAGGGNQSLVLPAIRRLSNWARETLGEARPRIRETEEELERVTTPSLRALQLFTRADQLEREENHAGSAELLKSALIEDPDFAAAYCWLAWALRNQGKPAEEYLEYARKGVELSNRVSERERYIIQGSYHLLAGDLEAALPIWETLVERYPDDYWGNGNLEELYFELGRLARAAQHQVQLSELRPWDFFIVARASWLLAKTTGELERVRPLVLRALELVSPDDEERFPFFVSWLEYYPLFEKWLQDDPKAALELADELSASLVTRQDPLRTQLSIHLGGFYLLLGLNGAARRLLPERDRKYPTWWPCFGLPAMEFLDRDGRLSEEAVRCMREYPPSDLPFLELALLISTGAVEEADELLQSTEDRDWAVGGARDIARGELLLAQGKREEAVASLLTGLELSQNEFLDLSFFSGSERLAHLLEDRGDVWRAMVVLEKASATRAKTWGFTATFWLRNEWLLARLYRRAGEEEKARETENRLRRLLACADPDHPILASLSQAEGS